MHVKGLVEGEKVNGGCDVVGDGMGRKRKVTDSGREERSDGQRGKVTEGGRGKSISADVGLSGRRKGGDIHGVVLMALDVVEQEGEGNHR